VKKPTRKQQLKMVNLDRVFVHPFFYQSTFPQYRKIVRGKVKLLDGTETSKTKIIKIDHSSQYKKWRAMVMKDAWPNDEFYGR
jgi:hypothetical protein